MSFTTSIDVINLENDSQMIQINHALHTIEKKIIPIERSYHIIRDSTIEEKNVVLYATKLIANQSIILERSEMHQKHD